MNIEMLWGNWNVELKLAGMEDYFINFKDISKHFRAQKWFFMVTKTDSKQFSKHTEKCAVTI